MIEIATEIAIDASPETVWGVLTDLAGYADWNPYLVRVEGEARAGAAISVTQRPMPDADPITAPVEVVACAPFEMVWTGGLPERTRFRGTHVFRVEAAGAGTRFVHFEHFEGSDAAAILARYGDAIRTNFGIFNAALKARAEAPSA